MKDPKEQVQKKAQKVLENQGSLPLAHLDALIELGDKIDGLAEAMDKMPKTLSVEGLQKIEIKGDKGDQGEVGPQGETGPQGEKGDKGDTGKDGKDGKDGKNGTDGLDGENGVDGKDGKDGANGKDGSPDLAEDIVKKLQSLKDEARLDAKAIKNLPQFTREIVREVGAHAGAYETPLKDATTGRLLNKDASGAWLITASGSSGLTTADNGLTANTATNVQLGGTLLQNTTVLGASTYSLGLSGFTTFAASAVNTNISASNNLSLFASVSLRLATPFIQSSSATAGWVFTLQNATTGEGEWNAPASVSVNLAAVSAASTTTPNSLYTMTSTIPVEFKTSSGAHLLYLSEASAFVGIGNNAPLSKLHVVDTATTAIRGILADQYSADTISSRITMRKARGTFASPTVIITGDNTASFMGQGYDGTNFVDSARLLMTSTGTISTGVVAGTMALQTANSSGTLTSGLTISAAQIIALPAYTSNGVLQTTGGVGTVSVNTNIKLGSIKVTFDGQGGVISTGVNGSGSNKFTRAGTITGWTIESINRSTGAAVSGSIVIDTWKDTYANFPATVADTIWGGTKPSLSSQSKNTASGLSIAVAAGDDFIFNVDSATTVQNVVLTIDVLWS